MTLNKKKGNSLSVHFSLGDSPSASFASPAHLHSNWIFRTFLLLLSQASRSIFFNFTPYCYYDYLIHKLAIYINSFILDTQQQHIFTSLASEMKKLPAPQSTIPAHYDVRRDPRFLLNNWRRRTSGMDKDMQKVISSTTLPAEYTDTHTRAIMTTRKDIKTKSILEHNTCHHSH